MRKFLSCVLCAILAISAMAVSAYAEETNNAVSEDSYRDEFIGALMNEESLWVDPYDVAYYEIQFIDLNFDGKKEFVVQYYGNGTVHGSDIYSFDNGSVRKVENDDSGMIVQTESLKGYYDSTADSYKMIGSYVERAGIVGTIYCSNFELLYNTDSQSLKANVYSRNEVKTDTATAIETTTYYSADDKAVAEEEYNSINDEVISGLVDVNLKFEKEDVRKYKTLSISEKKEKLEWLYGSSSYDNNTVEPPTPNPDNNDNNNDNNNNNTNTNTDNTIKSPKTGDSTNVGGMLAVLLASGAAAVLAGRKSRKEDI